MRWRSLLVWFGLLSPLGIKAESPEANSPMVLVPGKEHPLAFSEEWRPLGFQASYFNFTGDSEDNLELWFSALTAGGRNSMVRLPFDGEGFPRLEPIFDTTLVKQYERELHGLEFPILTRASGYVSHAGKSLVLAAVGPRYTGGASELVPWLFLEDGEGGWKSLGLPEGEPREFVEAAWERGLIVRSEVGGLAETSGGQKRMYLHGLTEPDLMGVWQRGNRLVVPKVLVAEAKNWEGPWSFIRHEDGRLWDIREESGLPWLFPHIQRIAENQYLFTGASSWPPNRIYAGYSRDGLHFVVPADKNASPVPLLTQSGIGEEVKFVKGLRGVRFKSGEFRAAVSMASIRMRGRSHVFSTEGEWADKKLHSLLGEKNR